MSSAESHLKAHDDIQVLNPLEIVDWDVMLRKVPSANLFHTAAWARVLNSTYAYEPVYFATGSQNTIESLLPVMEINSWLTGRRGISLPFTDACEPLGARASSVTRLVEFAQNYAAGRKWKYLEYRGGRNAVGNATASTSYYNHCLQLHADEATMFGHFAGSVRQAVRKAEQQKLTVEFSQSPAGIREFYNLFCLTRQKHGVPPQPFAFFSNIQRHVLAHNLGWVALARQGGVPVAGAVYFHFGKSALYKFGASNHAFQHLRANNLVMWEAIRRYAREGYTSFEFGRTDQHNDGLRRFKLSWGAEERRIDYFRYELRANSYVKLNADGEGLYQRFGRYLPRFLSRLIGLLLYKHIAAFTFSMDWSRFGYTS